MSAFLAPIHYWLYNKIMLVNERTVQILNSLSPNDSEIALIVSEMATQSIGASLLDKELADIIDHDNIHAWLQKKINLVETREAFIINEIVVMLGDDVISTIKSVFQKSGQHYGNIASSQNTKLLTPHSVYKLVNDYFLNGMPCDQCDKIVTQTPTTITWENQRWLQEINWQRANADVKLLADLYLIWMQSFIQNLDNRFYLEYKHNGDKNSFTLFMH